jgi:hypothetical protein
MSATENTLHIVNYFSDTVSVSVTNDQWNCCDLPQRGQVVGAISPGGVVDLPYVRTGGHGCDGKQGQFQLAITTPSTGLVNFDFDSNGNIEFTPPWPVPPQISAALRHENDGTYTCVLNPVVKK